MSNFNMRDLNEALISRGFKSRFEMTGGGIGTIYLSFNTEKGPIYMGIGPSNFDTGGAYSDELNWGKEALINGEMTQIEDSIYYDPEIHGEFTAENIANAICKDLTK